MAYLIGGMVGLAVGTFWKSILNRRQILAALDTVGIRRTEFLKVIKDLNLMHDILKDQNIRIRILEQLREGK